jgi:hypothetical protein
VAITLMLAAFAWPTAAQEPSPGTPGRAASETAPGASGTAWEAKFFIKGQVVNAITGAPVSNCHLSATPMSGRRTRRRLESRGAQEITAAADSEGRFEMAMPSAGGWSLTASARGYRTQALDEHDGYSTAVVLSEADPVFALTFKLTPAAAIEGFVLDDAGEAVRNGDVTLTQLPAATPEDAHPRGQVRSHERTDDRGYYKFSGIAAGSYEVSVHAEPWYAAVGLRASAGAAPSNEAPDALDVVYPTVWYPGVTDHAAAAPIALHGGEVREADFRMLPMPGFQLKIPSGKPAATENRDSEGRPVTGAVIYDEVRPVTRMGATILELLPDGSEVGVHSQMRVDANGDIEYGGLAPGNYMVQVQGSGTERSSSSTLVQIGPNSTRTVDLSQGTPGTVVTVRTDPEVDTDALQIRFRNVASGISSNAELESDRGHRAMRQLGPNSGDALPSERRGGVRDRAVTLQPGKYEVYLSGAADLHLVSISATEAKAVGRVVTIGEGSPVLTLHVAAGRGRLRGTVRSANHPDAGSMVLLVPATLGSAFGLNVLRRDQSNSDGSFEITGILPGAYILVAIHHGWDVNWSDAASLQRFLPQGMPLEIKPSDDLKVSIKAQSPVQSP